MHLSATATLRVRLASAHGPRVCVHLLSLPTYTVQSREYSEVCSTKTRFRIRWRWKTSMTTCVQRAYTRIKINQILYA